MKQPLPIAILGEYSPDFKPHAATVAAIDHSAAQLEREVNATWVSTAAITDDLFQTYSAIWVAPGSPYKNMDATLATIHYARENGVPCLGTCGGFQHMVLEYARNVLKFSDAAHAEYDPYASNLFVSELECSLAGRQMLLQFSAESRVSEIYDSLSATEEYYCNFGIHPAQVSKLKSGPMQVVGADAEGEVRVIELPGHPFFVGTLFVPQLRSTPADPHPLITAFLAAADLLHSLLSDSSVRES